MGGGAIFRFCEGGYSCYEGGHRAHGGSPTRENPVTGVSFNRFVKNMAENKLWSTFGLILEYPLEYLTTPLSYVLLSSLFICGMDLPLEKRDQPHTWLLW